MTAAQTLKQLDKEFTAMGVDVEAAKRVILAVRNFNYRLFRAMGSGVILMRGYYADKRVR